MLNLFHEYHFLVEVSIEHVVLVKYISYTAAHAGCKVLSCASEYYRNTACHVFAAVFTDAFNNSLGS